MKLVGEEMRKYEYILDVFKGTCELNDYEGIRVPAFDEDGSPCHDVTTEAIAAKPDNVKKAYYYGHELDKEETVILGAVCDDASAYARAEMINMAVKFLSNVNVEELTVEVSGPDAKELQNILEMTSIPVDITNEADSVFTFQVNVDGEKIAFGGGAKDDSIFLEIKYSPIAAAVDYKEKKTPLDVYIAPSEKEVLDDAFAIGTDLRDAGFKVEIDYSLKQVTKDDVDATFLVTFDKEDIAKYEVKLIDMATKELKSVSIDNLIEEIMFI